jgi:hypothetical protein
VDSTLWSVFCKTYNRANYLRPGEFSPTQVWVLFSTITTSTPQSATQTVRNCSDGIRLISPPGGQWFENRSQAHQGTIHWGKQIEAIWMAMLALRYFPVFEDCLPTGVTCRMMLLSSILCILTLVACLTSRHRIICDQKSRGISPGPKTLCPL